MMGINELERWGLPNTYVNIIDDAEMILIPEGDFMMGSSDDDQYAHDDEKPQHKVYLDNYYIYKTEVTVAQYRKFCEETERDMPESPYWGSKDNNPIVNVSWYDAKAYAEWAGVILPTEAQWEKAARSDDGRIYPWGNKWDKNKCANYVNSGAGYTTEGTHSVGSFINDTSAYGVMDMAGNVSEWCRDWYGADYYDSLPAKNPTGPTTGDYRVLRGGTWDYDGNTYNYRGACRGVYYDPVKYGANVGFRCILPVQKTKTNPKDNAEMILIPAGDFIMGSKDDDNIAINDEKPQHKVYIDTYYIYKNEVTVAQYRNFCTETGTKMPKEPSWKWQDTHPIVNVTWNEAKAYAKWAGVTLPTEAQWEKAARGEEGFIYPWGNEWDETKCANYANSGAENSIRGTHPVGSFLTGVSPYGVMDMAGNVWEWCEDWYGGNYYEISPTKNPTGPVKGDLHVLRGGSWDINYYSTNDGNRGAYRYYGTPNNYYASTGFRCALPVSVSQLINSSPVTTPVIQLPVNIPVTTPVIQLPVEIPETPTIIQHPVIKVNQKDDAEMILIPEGDFLMGSTDADKRADDNEKPQRKVYMDAYYIYKTEVTVSQYRKFCIATIRKMPDVPDWGWSENHPIVNVSWNEAKAYANWAGVSLPTEAQWEKAARGNDGIIYPWGNEWDKTKCANYTNSGNGDTTWGTHTVGSFLTGASPYGVLDMAGNAGEWCADLYSADYYKTAPLKNPTGPFTGRYHVYRGGSWHNYNNNTRGAYRSGIYSIDGGNLIGFRCTLRVP